MTMSQQTTGAVDSVDVLSIALISKWQLSMTQVTMHEHGIVHVSQIAH